MKIERLSMRFFSPVRVLFSRVVSSMREAGIDQWDELYPDSAVLEADIRSGTAFGLFPGAPEGTGFEPKAYVMLNEDESAEYQGVSWAERGGSPLVIHRLCVDPGFRHQGAAKRLVSFAEGHALSSGHTSIRLDAFSGNPAALALYESLGYERRGEVVFRKGRFFCYEKILRP